jgi:hypothetical protein
MPPARYRQWLLGTFCGKHRPLEFFDALRPEDAVHASAIELRVDVIHYLGIVHSAESQLRTEVESCRSGEELPSIDQLMKSPDLRVSRDARKTMNKAIAWRKRIVIEVFRWIPSFAGWVAAAKPGADAQKSYQKRWLLLFALIRSSEIRKSRKPSHWEMGDVEMAPRPGEQRWQTFAPMFRRRVESLSAMEDSSAEVDRQIWAGSAADPASVPR